MLFQIQIDLSHVSLQLSCDPNEDDCTKTDFDILLFQSPVDSDVPWMDLWPNRDFCCSEDSVQSGQ